MCFICIIDGRKWYNMSFVMVSDSQSHSNDSPIYFNNYSDLVHVLKSICDTDINLVFVLHTRQRNAAMVKLKKFMNFVKHKYKEYISDVSKHSI